MEKKVKKMYVELSSDVFALDDLLDFLIQCMNELVKDVMFTDSVLVHCTSRDDKIDALFSW